MFGPNVRVNHGGDLYQQDRPSAAFSPQGILYVVWEDWRHGTGSAYLARSFDDGLTFESEVRVDAFGPESLDEGSFPERDRNLLLLQWPQVAVDGQGIVYVAFTAWMTGEVGQIYCTRSTDQGQSFEPPVRVSDADSGDRHWPAIAGVPDGGAHLVWCDFRNGEDVIDLYTSRTENGVTFSPNVKANLAPVGPSCTPPLPKIAVSGASPVAGAGTGMSAGMGRGMGMSTGRGTGMSMSMSMGMGMGMGAETDTNTSTDVRMVRNPDDPTPGAANGVVHIAWRQTTLWPQRWIYACRSEDQGASFLPAVAVSHEPWFFDG